MFKEKKNTTILLLFVLWAQACVWTAAPPLEEEVARALTAPPRAIPDCPWPSDHCITRCLLQFRGTPFMVTTWNVEAHVPFLTTIGLGGHCRSPQVVDILNKRLGCIQRVIQGLYVPEVNSIDCFQEIDPSLFGNMCCLMGARASRYQVSTSILSTLPPHCLGVASRGVLGIQGDDLDHNPMIFGEGRRSFLVVVMFPGGARLCVACVHLRGNEHEFTQDVDELVKKVERCMRERGVSELVIAGDLNQDYHNPDDRENVTMMCRKLSAVLGKPMHCLAPVEGLFTQRDPKPDGEGHYGDYILYSDGISHSGDLCIIGSPDESFGWRTAAAACTSVATMPSPVACRRISSRGSPEVGCSTSSGGSPSPSASRRVSSLGASSGSPQLFRIDRGGWEQVIESLVDNGSLNKQLEEGKSESRPVCYAIANGHVEALKALVRAGAEVTLCDVQLAQKYLDETGKELADLKDDRRREKLLRRVANLRRIVDLVRACLVSALAPPSAAAAAASAADDLRPSTPPPPPAGHAPSSSLTSPVSMASGTYPSAFSSPAKRPPSRAQSPSRWVPVHSAKRQPLFGPSVAMVEEARIGS